MRQFHVFHACIGQINLLLEFLTFNVHLLRDHCNGAEDISVDKGTAYKKPTCHWEQEGTCRIHIVSHQPQDSVVESHRILIDCKSVIEQKFLDPMYLVLRRGPGILREAVVVRILTGVVPKTCRNIDVQDQEEANLEKS